MNPQVVAVAILEINVAFIIEDLTCVLVYY